MQGFIQIFAQSVFDLTTRRNSVTEICSTSNYIRMMVMDATNRKAVMQQVIDHVPNHKQVLSAEQNHFQ